VKIDCGTVSIFSSALPKTQSSCRAPYSLRTSTQAHNSDSSLLVKSTPIGDLRFALGFELLLFRRTNQYFADAIEIKITHFQVENFATPKSTAKPKNDQQTRNTTSPLRFGAWPYTVDQSENGRILLESDNAGIDMAQIIGIP